MKYSILLLGLVLCGQVHNVLPTALHNLQEFQEDLGSTGHHDYQAVRRNLQRPVPPSPSISTARFLQSGAEPGPPGRLAAPTASPTPADRAATAPQPRQRPCPASSTCSMNLMHKNCDLSCVPDYRVAALMRSGWVCGRCR
jgi:hypothetical protein